MVFTSITEKKWVFVLILCAVSGFFIFYQLGARNFCDIRKESRRAEIAREMVDGGDWLIPHLNNQVILTKPPLYYWSVALASGKTGVTELTSRIPSAISGIGTILFTFLIGSLFFNPSTGFFAGLILLTTNLFYLQARYAELDTMLTFFTTGAIYYFIRGYQKPEKLTSSSILFFLFLGLGTMTKGPFAFTVPLIPITLWLLRNKELHLLKSKKFLISIIVFFAVLLPWCLAISFKRPQFVSVVLVETLAKYATGYAHARPFFYYFEKFWKLFFPWSLLLPFSCLLILTNPLKEKRKELVFLLLWFLANFLFFSISKSKRGFYLLPLTPCVALLVAATWNPLVNTVKNYLPSKRRLITSFSFILGIILIAIPFLIKKPFIPTIPDTHFPKGDSFALFAGLILVSIVAINLLTAHKKRNGIYLSALILILLGFQSLYPHYSIPFINRTESAKDFYLKALHLIKPDEEIGYYGKYENYALIFYTARYTTFLGDEEKVRSFMKTPERRFIITSSKRYPYFENEGWKKVLTSPYSDFSSKYGYGMFTNHNNLTQILQ
ncbi:MAG: glycosyltransferase family 39 protein [Deltaproteobacteria bacterium]|nr:glycosyltransferase family 39 protein [Deltaproteobacteria bacterium]